LLGAIDTVDLLARTPEDEFYAQQTVYLAAHHLAWPPLRNFLWVFIKRKWA
jgi:hypothetical protein